MNTEDHYNHYLRLDRTGFENVLDRGDSEEKAYAKAVVKVTSANHEGEFKVIEHKVCDRTGKRYTSFVYSDNKDYKFFYIPENKLIDINGIFSINIERIKDHKVTIGFIADDSVKFVRADAKGISEARHDS